MYYSDKLKSLKRIFGEEDIVVATDCLTVGSLRFPILDNVIILSEPDQYTPYVKSRLRSQAEVRHCPTVNAAEDIQYSFGEEWKEYSEILPDHQEEFFNYFDLVELPSLRNATVCDLGCGIGRWSYFLKDWVREIILVDFSDAIFLARKNLASSSHCLFFMGDLQRLPFQNNFCDFIYCLGVLHHLPTPCLDMVRLLRKFAPQILVFLYYALDNRPFYFRLFLKFVTPLRHVLCKIRNPVFRRGFSRIGSTFLYRPLILLGKLLRPLNLGHYIPLYDFYHDKTPRRIEQDVYDRFFTRIEQRVSQKEILGLRDSFGQIIVSSDIPYWHFLCTR